MANTVLGNLAAALSGFKVSTTGELSATVTLTNGQILALPTTPITIVAAPGAGFRVKLKAATLQLHIVTASYGNVDNTYSALVLSMTNKTGEWMCCAIQNKSAITTDDLDNFLGAAAGDSVYDLPVPYKETIALSTATTGDALQVRGNNPTNAVTKAEVENKALVLSVDNSAAGDFTGGNAANTLKVIVYYHLEAI